MALAAEIVGGAAVVITLAFLVLETRDNTRAVQAQTYLALTAELNRVRENLLDPRVAEVFANAVANTTVPVSMSDALIFRQVFEAVFSVYESAYYAREKGVLDDLEWNRFEQAICRNLRNAAVSWEPNPKVRVFGQGIRGVLTEQFANYVEVQCDWPAIRREILPAAEPGA